MLSIKAICKSENNEEVMIIGFELEGYCLCMTKSGIIFHAKHEDLTIVDKEYIKSFAKESIDFEIADFLEKASARLDQIQSKQLTSIILELQEYKDKIEQGTLVELPCKVGDTVYVIYQYDDFMGTTEEPFIEKDTVSFFVYDDNKMKIVPSNYAERSVYWCTTIDILLTREEAEKRLKE